MSPQPRNATTLQATRITSHTTTHTNCRRCGITITYDRSHRYNGACHDCAPYYNTPRRTR